MEPEYIQKRLTDSEVFAAFPEAKQIIRQKQEELQLQRKAVRIAIKERLAVINRQPDELSRYVGRKWLKLTLGEELLTINKHIARLKRQDNLLRGKKPSKNAITDDMVQKAREVPIEDLLNQQLRRSGNTLKCHCPFHEERTPSFHIYPKENRGWCFGCNQGGDAIAIAILLHGCTFKEAVLMLTGGRV